MPMVGVDYGARRVGIAITESDVLATPHGVLKNDGDLTRLADSIVAVGAAIQATVYVVGIPLHPRARLRNFHALAELLRQKTCKDVVVWDETLTTVEATERARERGASRHDRKGTIDMHAAAIILQSYLDSRHGRKP